MAVSAEKWEALDQALKMKAKFEAAGLDVTEMGEHLQKSAVAISEQLDTLLSGEPTVTVNKVRISVVDEVSGSSLPLTAQQLLEDQHNSAQPQLPPPSSEEGPLSPPS